MQSTCKKCRRAGEKLFLKGERCYGPKCAMVKNPNPPGIHIKASRRRGGGSEYGKQLAEKQKMKRTYGIRERQFKRYVQDAVAAKGDTREIILKKLETRLDNVVFRLGWAKSRTAARQLVSHGHILVNKKRVNIPSYQVKKDQVIALGERIKKSALLSDLSATLKKYESPSWLNLNKETLEAKIVNEPTAAELGNLNLVGMVVEFYSR